MPEGRRPIRVLFLIRQLDVGGAEQQLLTLLRSLDRSRVRPFLVALHGPGERWHDFANIPDLELTYVHGESRTNLRSLRRLTAAARAFRPDVVHGYMSGANALASLLAMRLGAKSVWGIRVSDQDFTQYRRFRRLVYQAERTIATWPALIIANSSAGRRSHIAAGYPSRRFIVIPNGIDTSAFTPDSDAGRRWRSRHGFADTDLVIGLPARIDPMKDHRTFLEAIRLLGSQEADRTIRAVCIGNGPEAAAQQLRLLTASLDLQHRLTWLPAASDMVALYNGLDVVVSASAFGEGFPNVIGEAMACGRVCVTTTCGDAADVVGQAGMVVPIRSPEGLAKALAVCAHLGVEGRRRLGEAARSRIAETYSVARLTARTEAALQAVVAHTEDTLSLDVP